MKKTILLSDCSSIDGRLPLVHALCGYLNAPSDAPILAGGAPRDLLLGERPRDYDLFIGAGLDDAGLADTLVRVLSATRRFEQETNEPELFIASKTAEAYQRDDIRYVLGTKLDQQGSPGPAFVDFIFTRDYGPTGAGIVGRFDSPLCEAWATWTPEGFELESSAAFDKFHEHRVLGYWTDRTGDGAHIERLHQKFPEYLVLPMGRARRARQADPPRVVTLRDRIKPPRSPVDDDFPL